MPERAPPMLAATLNVTEPFPLPLAPAVTVTHAALLLAVQVQPLPAVTVTVPLPPVSATVAFDGPTRYVQAPGTAGPSGVSACPACVTVDLWSPRMIVPIRRSSKGLGGMVRRTVAAPLPVTGVANEIQLAFVAMVHEQPLIVDTATSRVPPLASMERLSGPSSNRQGAACCETRTRLSLTTISPSRLEGSGLGATRNSTVLVPCPEVGDSPESQFAAVDTSHGHSGVVVTVTVPVPPSGPILEEEAANATSTLQLRRDCRHRRFGLAGADDCGCTEGGHRQQQVVAKEGACAFDNLLEQRPHRSHRCRCQLNYSIRAGFDILRSRSPNSTSGG